MDKIVYAVLTVPLILIIGTVVLSQFTNSSQSNWEDTITAEAKSNITGVCTPAAPCTNTRATSYPVKDGTLVVTMKNISGSTLSGNDINESVTYDSGRSDLTVTIVSAYNGSVSLAYTGYSMDGYDTFLKSEQGTWNGFNLASMLPFILAAMALIAIILGAFAVQM